MRAKRGWLIRASLLGAWFRSPLSAAAVFKCQQSSTVSCLLLESWLQKLKHSKPPVPILGMYWQQFVPAMQGLSRPWARKLKKTNGELMVISLKLSASLSTWAKVLCSSLPADLKPFFSVCWRWFLKLIEIEVALYFCPASYGPVILLASIVFSAGRGFVCILHVRWRSSFSTIALQKCLLAWRFCPTYQLSTLWF